MQKHDKRLWLPLCACALVVTGDLLAQAAPKPKEGVAAAAKTPGKSKGGKSKKEASSPNKVAVQNARSLLASNKRENVEAGIQSLGLLGTKEAVEPLAERMRQGLPPELLEAAIVTLMALAQPEAGPILFELSAHRRPEVRLRAVEAIAATNPPGAENTLSAALSDDDPKVRAAAATGLGEIGAAGSLEKLFLALDRGNMEASGAIGRVVNPNEVKRLSNYLGQVPFRNLGPALAQVLQRTDVQESAKLDIVARLEEVGTKEVKGYLGDLLGAAGGTLSPALSRAMLRAMQEIAE